jgi:hypothetical protein
MWQWLFRLAGAAANTRQISGQLRIAFGLKGLAENGIRNQADVLAVQ